MLKNLLLISFVVIVLALAWYFLWYKPGQILANQGKPCTIGGFPGKLKNGVCVKIAVGSGSISFK